MNTSENILTTLTDEKKNKPNAEELKPETTAVPEKTELSPDELAKASGGEDYQEYLKDIEDNTIPIFF